MFISCMYKSNKAKLITTHMQKKRSYSASVLSNKHNNATWFFADNAGDCEKLMLRKTGKPGENKLLRLQLHRNVSSAMAEHSIPERNTMHFRDPNLTANYYLQLLWRWRQEAFLNVGKTYQSIRRHKAEECSLQCCEDLRPRSVILFRKR